MAESLVNTRSSSPSSITSSPSLSAASDSSDATSVSSAPAQKTIVLPSSAFANAAFLSKIAEELERGSGELVVLQAGKADLLGLRELGREWGGDESVLVPAGTQWAVEGDESGRWYVKGSAVSAGEVEFEVPEAAGGEAMSRVEMLNVLAAAGLRAVYETKGWYVCERAAVAFPPLSLAVKPFGLPTPADWHHLWRAWDTVTLGMIPSAMLHTKPIDLRHVCVFYIGHIPMFLDMLLSKTLEEDLSEPRYFKDIFERGIDPNIDDPEHCHPHSIVPTRAEDWPTLATILQFRDTVRSRLLSIYQDVEGGKRAMTRRLARTIVLCLEHEGFHVETLLYMLLQRAGSGTIPPPGPVPPFEALAKQWAAAPAPCAERAVLGPAEVELGHDDQENEDLLEENVHEFENHEFGWDNESPRRVVQVGKVEFEWRPVSNGEFRAFLEREATKEESKVKMPASWVEEDGQVKVRTLYGPVAFHIAEHWPVLTSYDNLFAYAQSKGGRLPTEPELRLFLDKYEVGYEGGGNVGFRNWHPVPSTMGIMDVDGGRGSNGGVWEWTSTLFDGHDGLDPTTLFTGYSTDFFDEVHHVVLGASYATIPRLAGRRTLRNFYQHNYPYPWVAGRIVYDA